MRSRDASFNCQVTPPPGTLRRCVSGVNFYLVSEIRVAAVHGGPADNERRSSAVASVRHSTRLRCASQVNFYLACHVVDVFSLRGAHGSKWGDVHVAVCGWLLVHAFCRSTVLFCICIFVYCILHYCTGMCCHFIIKIYLLTYTVVFVCV